MAAKTPPPGQGAGKESEPSEVPAETPTSATPVGREPGGRRSIRRLEDRVSADYEMLRRECELALDPSGPTLAYADGNQFYRDVLFLLVRVEELEAALRKHERVLAPLDAKIDFALTVGGEQQMRADLAYLRGLLAEALTHVRAALAVAGVSPLPGEAGKERG